MQIWFSHIFLARTNLLCAPSIHLSSCTNWLTLCLKCTSSEYLYNKHCMQKRNYRQTDAVWRVSLLAQTIEGAINLDGNMIFASCLSLKTIDISILSQFARLYFPALHYYCSLSPLPSFFQFDKIWFCKMHLVQLPKTNRNPNFNSWKLNKHFGNILVCFVFSKQLLHSTAQFELKTIKLFLHAIYKKHAKTMICVKRWRRVT